MLRLLLSVALVIAIIHVGGAFPRMFSHAEIVSFFIILQRYGQTHARL